MSGHIVFHPHAGSSITRTCEDTQRIADLLGVTVEFRFNDVLCMAGPAGSASRLAQSYLSEIERKVDGPHDRRFASSTMSRRTGGVQ